MFIIQRNLIKCGRQLRTIANTSTCFSKNNESSNEDDKKSKDKEETVNKLNALLKIMVEDDSSKNDTASQSLELSRPKQKFGKRFHQKEKGLGDKLIDAAKDVAETIGGDTQKTEAELLDKLLGKTSSSSASLTDVLSGMKVEQTPETDISRAQQVRTSLQRGTLRLGEGPQGHNYVKQLKKRVYSHVDIFGADPSAYFKDINPAKDIVPKLETWEHCLNKELRIAVTHPPSNIYEEMMIWTDRGMFWKFPIDNEQGLEDEKRVSFEEHIFLENHLGWCPEKGPIKHFMELVVVGLSKNFWMTAEEKKQHIFWYRDYFKDKNALLKDIGLGTIQETKEQNEATVQS